jgi:WhiB family redox-sensing transcriptional regulator
MSTLIESNQSETSASNGYESADWRPTQTPCREYDAELWFAESADLVARAQALCATCPLRAACLAGAVERREPWGVWGGEVFERGIPVARKRQPGRPRKDDHLRRAAAEQALEGRLADLVDDTDLDLEFGLLAAGAEHVSGAAA